MRNFVSAAAFLLLILFGSCGQGNKVKVIGEVDGLKDSTIYLVRSGLDKSSIVDSVKVDKEGGFRFSIELPKECPEFYQIVLGNQAINLAADSAETIKIKTTASGFGDDYHIEGSPSAAKIRTMALCAMNYKKFYEQLAQAVKEKKISEQVARDSVIASFARYQKEITAVIMEDTKSPAAYFGLFQRIYGSATFSPYDAKDNRIFGAVATAYEQKYPQSTRTKHLVNLTLNGKKNIRMKEGVPGNGNADLSHIKINEAGVFEIELPNLKGKSIKLSDLKGKVVLLSFTAYAAKESPALNLLLAESYRKLKSKGLEIYQISLDEDANLWMNAAENIPWIAVRDARSIESEYISLYNVGSLPMHFIIDRNGDIVKRVDNPAQIESSLNQYLK